MSGGREGGREGGRARAGRRERARVPAVGSRRKKEEKIKSSSSKKSLSLMRVGQFSSFSFSLGLLHFGYVLFGGGVSVCLSDGRIGGAWQQEALSFSFLDVCSSL